MRILFVGEAWLGSCARSMKEALARRPAIELDELAEDAFVPKARTAALRVLNRITRPLYRREFNRTVLDKLRHERPDFFMTYKGNFVQADLLHEITRLGVRTVNIYPDCSPHAHGIAHREAVGLYDTVISTKPYHPSVWEEVYGYHNRCLFVPQGYDPLLHLVNQPPADFDFDVVLIATYRPQYGRLMQEFAKALGNAKLKVAIGGYGWGGLEDQLPAGWTYAGPLPGRGYISLLRSARICVAPLTREMIINGQRQPGDVDTTRTYELAAAHCFFIHQRTDFVRGLYEEAGVPMFDDGAELAAHVMQYLAMPEERVRIALAAHRRAVPAFSTDSRASEIHEILKAMK